MAGGRLGWNQTPGEVLRDRLVKWWWSVAGEDVASPAVCRRLLGRLRDSARDRGRVRQCLGGGDVDGHGRCNVQPSPGKRLRLLVQRCDRQRQWYWDVRRQL